MKAKSNIKSYERKKNRAGLYFILPWIIGLVVFFIRPLTESVLLSFSKINQDQVLGYSLKFIGINNYIDAFTKDPVFSRLVTQSLPQMLYQVPIIIIFSLFMAIILNQKFFMRTFVRGAFFLPVIIASGVVLSIMKGDVFAGTVMSSNSSSQMFQSEFLKNLLLETGFNQQLVYQFTAVVDGMFNLIWKAGIQILIFLAGLQTIGPPMYEAAKIEGATGWECFWKITFPMISSITLLNLIFTIVDSFTDYSNDVMAHINNVATGVGLNLELSSAMAWVYFIFVGLILLIVYLIVNKKVFYNV